MYFESWTPALMEDDTDDSQINELFVQETVDPRIESVMPILSRLHTKIGETPVKEVKELEEWAESISTIIETEQQSSSKLKVGDDVICDYTGKPMHVTYVHSSGKVKLANEKGEPQPNYRNPENLKKITSDIGEGEETLEEGSDTSPVESSILNRIAMVRTDLLKHGIDKVMDAVKEVAYNVGDVEEIGSSDVSGWIRQVERILGSQEVDEDLDPQQKKAGQLGPTEKVGKEGAVGKLVGANESVEDKESEAGKRWKFSNMDYDEAVKKYGKDNVKKGPKNKLGEPTIEILSKLDEGQEDLDFIKKLVK
jgi:hypothetical protein